MAEPSLPKTFEPARFEERWYAHWEKAGAFRPHRPDAPPFTISLPPPNVTGTLHIGHALDQTLQDVLIRWQRLKGADARWIVGTDHAGIATQMVVERTIAGQGLTRQGMGREAFLQTVWDWKAQSGGAITRQMRRLGASCDWANERFTMDEGMTRAVTEAFVTLHERGLIYRDKRLVNWDPKFQTAISDLEVETREVQGHFWHLRYPLADGPLPDGTAHLVVATTRPETMLGDTAVAVHPEDDRYRHLVGRMIAHPLTGRPIPIIADTWADPELGSGCVKITPAHDFNDWAVYERHREIGWLNVMDAEARIIQTAGVPEKFVAMDRFDARKAVVAELEALGLVERIEERLVQVPHGDRSGVPIEPLLTDQWYVDAPKMAVEARRAVEDGRTRFVPESWAKTYFHWLDNIQPWCISRQLWWGHRIPAWYGPATNDGKLLVSFVGENEKFVGRTERDAISQVRTFYGLDENTEIRVVTRDEFYEKYADRMFGLSNEQAFLIYQDEDVLDTWFSSGLWPFATLGWPDETPDPRHFPGSVLVTAFDIIFFWVARMMMQSLELTDKHPFSTVYIHGLVRDRHGQKMSKSKNNTVDPLELVNRYGADALRFAMAASETQGRDVKFDEKRVEGARNFVTKLWNAARFAQSQGIGASAAPEPPAASHAVNRWIVAETARMAADVDRHLTDFRFDQACDRLYHFTWGSFCDWYLELVKPLLADEGDAAAETRAVAGWALDQILVCLHPVMPFVTEELWHALGDRDHDLILAQWPSAAPEHSDAAEEIGWLIELVSAIRSARAELNVPAAARLPLHAPEADSATHARLARNLPALQRLARVTEVLSHAAPAGGSAQLVVANATYALPLEGVIDLAAERARLEKAAAQAEKEASALAARLANPGFTERAKPEAVEKARDDHEARSAEATRLRAALARLG